MSDGIVVEPARQIGDGPKYSYETGAALPTPKPKKVRVPRERKPRTPRPPRVKVEAGIRVRDDSEKAKSWIATPEDVEDLFRANLFWKARKVMKTALLCAVGKENSQDYMQRLKIATDMAKYVFDHPSLSAGGGKGGKDISAFLLVIKERVVSLLPGEREQAALSAPEPIEAEVVEGEAEDA